jgi:hypothetical protein
VSLLSSSNFGHANEIERTFFIQEFLSSSTLDEDEDGSLRRALEPTPIDLKSAVVADTFQPANSTWYIDDSFDAIIRGMRTTSTLMIETSSTSCTSTVKGGGPPAAAVHVLADEAPKRNLLDNRSSFPPPFSPNKRAKMSSTTRSEVVHSSTSTCSSGDATTTGKLRSSQIEQWGKRFSELVEYQKQYGHCLVPLNWPLNPSLAHWVKRQRYQYRIKKEGKQSSMTPERLEALQELGFIWDSQSVAWLERWQELAEFNLRYGHPNVPKKYPENRQLAIWVKCQRRQYKLYAVGQSSNMTPDRIERLNSLGFVFSPRSVKAPPLLPRSPAGDRSWL